MNTKINSTKILLLSVFILASCLFVLFPGEAKATREFGGLEVHTKVQYPNGDPISLPGVRVTVLTQDGNTYSGRCIGSGTTYSGSGPYPDRDCGEAGIVDVHDPAVYSEAACLSSTLKFTPDADPSYVAWNTGTSDVGVVFSSCHCNFNIKLSAPTAPSGYSYTGYWQIYDEDISRYSGLGEGNTYSVKADEMANDSTFIPTFKIDLVSDLPDPYDTLTTTFNHDQGNADIDRIIDFYTPSLEFKFDWEYSHSSEPSHGIVSNTISFGDGTTVNLSGTSGTATHHYDWAGLGFSADPLAFPTGVRVYLTHEVECEGGITETKGLELHFTRRLEDDLIFYCAIDASPSSGYVPLAVNFRATITDSWGRSASKYIWEFGDDETDETTLRTVSHTYITAGSIFATVTAEMDNDSDESDWVGCPADIEINSETWSQSNYQEIAP